MIGYLEGNITIIDINKVIVHTQSGVGYEVSVAKSFVNENKANLFVCHIQKENGQDLYGFESIEEKKLFELLISVNGIGPKSAFGLLSHLGSESIINAITLEDVALLKSAPGVGKKSAEQLVLSLKDKIQKENFKTISPLKTKMTEATSKDGAKILVKETLTACVELGFKEQEILPVIQKLIKGQESLRPEEFIKHVLRELR